MEEYGLTVSQLKGNLNGCREQMKPGEEGIDGILEILKVYVCDEHRKKWISTAAVVNYSSTQIRSVKNMRRSMLLIRVQRIRS